MNQRTCAALSGIFLAAQLGACGGGGGGGGSTSPTLPPAPTLAPYIAYTQLPATSGDASLMLEHADTLPSTPVEVFTQVPPFAQMLNQVKLDSAGHELGWTHAGLLHFDEASPDAVTGNWKRIDFSTVTTPQPTVFSSETAAPCVPSIFNGLVGRLPVVLNRNLGDARTAFVVYELRGADGKCGTADDVYKAINVADSASDAPHALDGPAIGAIYGSGGMLAGILVEGATSLLYITDLQGFGGARTLATGLSGAYALADISVHGINGGSIAAGLGPGSQLLVEVTDSSNGFLPTIHRVDAAGNYSPALYTGVAQGSIDSPGSADSSAYYFFETYFQMQGPVTLPMTNLVKVPLDGSAPGSVIASFSGERYQMTGATRNNLIAEVSTESGTYYYARVPRAQQPGTPSHTQLVNDQPQYFTANGLYFHDPDSGSAILTDENETPVASFPLSQWAGTQLLPDGSGVVKAQLVAGHILLATGTGMTNLLLDNATLSVTDEQGHGTPLTAADGSAFSFSGENFSFLSGVSPDTGILDHGGNQDIFAVDFDLHHVSRITNSPDVSEYPLN